MKMKNYEDIIFQIAQTQWDTFLGDAKRRWFHIPVGTLAIIYGISPIQILKDLDNTYSAIDCAHMERFGY